MDVSSEGWAEQPDATSAATKPRLQPTSRLPVRCGFRNTLDQALLAQMTIGT
ncbi:hypothetical protein MLP_27850 [Microlunatus phosphovorus NM-1]|uniref:Uncharacterized protein n=1 Tax=Microlunatus phosphovorus (strain ATCC 700054 / DSM 10555 / JCM 9379 / NBRC 101784 / NCIMB 13414 / VKM Ac-1990 / NM-1) TaxID=1032480 RepID=F5XID0_MICPN|nr:hypothetical protein MLP_27850 [Microlunatus phosphovorus NM-1]